MAEYLEQAKALVKDVNAVVQEVKANLNFETEASKAVLKQFNEEVKTPFQFKKDYVFDVMDEGQRLSIFGLLTGSSALLARKVLKRGIISTTKITLFAYFGFGLFLYPEVFNSVFMLKGERFNCTTCHAKEAQNPNLGPTANKQD